jgi:DNA processing protein
MNDALWQYYIGTVFLKLKKRQWESLTVYFGTVQRIDWHQILKDPSAFGIETSGNALLNKALEGYKAFESQLFKLGSGYTYRDHFDFPAPLAAIEDSPEILFYLGNVKALNKKKLVSIVGTRQPSAYGLRVAYDLAAFLSKHDIGIVSGMATGIDTAAHRGALSANGYTAAVVATGVQNVYPKSNRTLYQTILEKDGAILSEKPLLENARRYDFPYRNRLISGLSQVTVVIEGAYKSGSLITAKYAAEQGRTVFALPGNIYAEASKGTNQLIFDGAMPLVDFSDVLTALSLQSMTPDSMCRQAEIAQLSEVERNVLQYLKKYNIIEIEALRTLVGIDTQLMNAAVARLIMEDFCTYASLTALQCLL